MVVCHRNVPFSWEGKVCVVDVYCGTSSMVMGEEG